MPEWWYVGGPTLSLKVVLLCDEVAVVPAFDDEREDLAW